MHRMEIATGRFDIARGFCYNRKQKGGDRMLRIALCDDEQESRETLASLLSEYFGTGASLKVYTDALPLIQHIQWEKDRYDLYLLDVIMPQLSGIELGRKLRSMGVSAPIIYLTSSRDYAVESYSVQAFHYLVKPIQKEKLFSVLAQAEQAIAQTKATSLPIHTSDGIVVVKTSDILYAELYARSVRYHLTNGASIDSQKLRISFQKAVSELLDLPSFIMLGSSFLINLHHVEMIGKKDLLLTNRTSLPLPKGTKQDVLNRWMDYWLADEPHPTHECT